MSLNPCRRSQDVREQIRVVVCAGMQDPIDSGEEVERFPPGTSLTVVRKTMIRLAMESRGVDVSIDLYSHKLIWERFVSVRYESTWTVDPETGIVDPLPEQTILDPASLILIERARFDRDREKREAAGRRMANRGQTKPVRSAESH